MLDKLKATVKLSKAIFASSTFPIKLTVGLTYRCQSKCNYCDIWKVYQRDPERYKNETESAVYLETLRDLKDHLLWVEFTGGEPFLRQDLSEIVSFALNNTRIIATGITTNGLDSDLVLRTTYDILRKSKKKQIVIGVSIDGDPETYKRSRGLNGFKNAMRTFLELKRLTSSYDNLRPHIAYTISRFNAGNFHRFYHYISEEYGIGIADISFAIEHPFGYYFQNHLETTRNENEFSKDAWKDVQFILGIRHESKINMINPLNRFYDYYLRNIPAYLNNPKQQVIPCKACELSAYIDPYGYVYPCIMWNQMIGSLKEKAFKAIWKSAKRESLMQTVRAGKCPNCWTPCEAQPSWFARGRWWQ
jgi:MoaA/NifB/PqqE/SkfB family radical SAM enzyme